MNSDTAVAVGGSLPRDPKWKNNGTGWVPVCSGCGRVAFRVRIDHRQCTASCENPECELLARAFIVEDWDPFDLRNVGESWEDLYSIYRNQG